MNKDKITKKDLLGMLYCFVGGTLFFTGTFYIWGKSKIFENFIFGSLFLFFTLCIINYFIILKKAENIKGEVDIK